MGIIIKLPDVHALLGGQIHGVALADLKGLQRIYTIQYHNIATLQQYDVHYTAQGIETTTHILNRNYILENIV